MIVDDGGSNTLNPRSIICDAGCTVPQKYDCRSHRSAFLHAILKTCSACSSGTGGKRAEKTLVDTIRTCREQILCSEINKYPTRLPTTDARVMSNSVATITAVVLNATTLQFATATTHCSGQPRWRTCVHVRLPKTSNPIHTIFTIEQLCGGIDPSVILVCQHDVRSLLLCRYAQNTVTLVDEASRSGRALWWPFVPSAWKSTLRTHWQVAGMIYTYARQRQLAMLSPVTGAGLFDRHCRSDGNGSEAS